MNKQSQNDVLINLIMGVNDLLRTSMDEPELDLVVERANEFLTQPETR